MVMVSTGYVTAFLDGDGINWLRYGYAAFLNGDGINWLRYLTLLNLG